MSVPNKIYIPDGDGEYLIACCEQCSPYYHIPNELVDRLNAARDQYRPIHGGAHRGTFWLMNDLLKILET